MQKKSKPIYSLLGVLFSVVVAVFVAQKLDWQELIVMGANIKWNWIILSLGAFILNNLLRTVRIRVLLSMPEIPFRQAFGITIVYGMFNFLLPAKSGEFSYLILTKRHLNTSIVEGAATLITARILDFSVIALLIPFVLIGFSEAMPNWMILSALVMCLMVCTVTIVLINYVRKIEAVPNEDARINRWYPKFIVTAWYKMFNALSLIYKRGQFAKLWLLTLGIWFCIYVNLYWIVLGLGIDVDFMQMVVVSIILIPLSLLPVQGVANIGSHELGWVTAFALFGYGVDTALVVAINSHIILFAFVMLMGLLGFVILNTSTRSLTNSNSSV